MASNRNCVFMAAIVAPTAMRIPISLVRSVTDTSMTHDTYPAHKKGNGGNADKEKGKRTVGGDLRLYYLVRMTDVEIIVLAGQYVVPMPIPITCSAACCVRGHERIRVLAGPAKKGDKCLRDVI